MDDTTSPAEAAPDVIPSAEEKPAESSGPLKTVKRLDIKSCAKIQAVICAAVYGIMGAFMTLFGLISLVQGEFMPLLMGLGVMIGGIIVGWILGYIFGALGAWIYNLAADKIGGVKVELS